MKRIQRFLTIAMSFAVLTACATHQKPILQPPDTMPGTGWTKEQIQRMAGSAAASNFYGATSRTGGASGSLDSIDGTNLAEGDASYVVQDGVFSVYRLNATSGAAEADPDVITPDTNAGNKRWILVFQGDPETAEIAQLAATDGNVIVGNGSTWVAESGNTARTSLGLGTGDSPDFTEVTESGNAVPNATNNLSFFAATTSAQLRAVLSDEVGTGGAYFVGGALGTPASGTLSNATGLPISTGVSGLGANVATFLGTPSSTNMAAAVTGETGSGAAVFGTSPTLTTPVIASIVPGANFTLAQNSVAPFTSEESGAVANTLYLKAGNVGIGTTSPSERLEIRSGSSDPEALVSSSGSAYIEFARDGYNVRGSVGALGGYEMNLSYNMDYATGDHKYYDSTKNAYWLTLQDGGMFLQHATSGITADDIWYASGDLPLIVNDAGNVILGTGGTTEVDHGETLQVLGDAYINPGPLTIKKTSAQTQFKMVSSPTNSTVIYLGDTDAEYRGAIKYDNSDDSLGVHTAAAERLRISAGGAVTKPFNPCFSAYNSATAANVTGDGTSVTVGFSGEIFDQGGNFSSSTFTAPVTGKYALETCVRVGDLETDTYEYGHLAISTSNRKYRQYLNWDAGYYDASDDTVTRCMSVLADMDAGDTATVELSAGGGTKTLDIIGQATNTSMLTWFQGRLAN